MAEPQQNKPLRLLAGIWFAAASCLPLSLLWIEFVFGSAEKPWHIFLAAGFGYFVLPIVIAGVFGLLLGSDILDPERVGTAKRALVRGGLVALSSALTYTLFLGLFVGIGMSISEHPPRDIAILEVVQLFLVGLIGTLILGLLTVGWIAVIVGAIAGWLLYKFGPNLHKRSAKDGPRRHENTGL